mgnify:CR=1 FL=1
MATMEYKCPACGGALEFNITEQKMKCPFCDSVFEVSQFQDMDKDLDKETKKAKAAPSDDEAAAKESTGGFNDKWNFDKEAGTEWGAGEEEALSVFLCESCGGEIVGDDTLASARCPYCDSIMVRKEQLSGSLKPDYVIPFKLGKDRAKEEFKKHLLGKKLLDRRFVDENKIDEIKGVYVPFWLFDVSLDADLTYEGIDHRSWREGDYMVYESDINDIHLAGEVAFNTIPVDGSSKMADDLMESLEPFDFREAVPFQTAYLAGYMADKYDVTVSESMPNVRRRVRGSAVDIFSQDVPHFDTITNRSADIFLKDSQAKYALYPVWLLTIKWDGEIYLYAMNGQTGKFVGDTLPCDNKKARRMQFTTTGLVAVAGLVFGVLAGMWW